MFFKRNFAEICAIMATKIVNLTEYLELGAFILNNY